MFELTTYNAAIEKGLAKGISEGLSQGLIERERRGETSGRLSQARKSLLALEAQLGVLPAEVRNRVLSSDSLEGLDALFLRGVTASSWSELFPA